MKQTIFNKLLFVSILIIVGNILPMVASADSYFMAGPPVVTGTVNISGPHIGSAGDPFQIGDTIKASGTAVCKVTNCFQSIIVAFISRADHSSTNLESNVQYVYKTVNTISGSNQNTVPVGDYHYYYFDLHGETSFTVPNIPGDYVMNFTLIHNNDRGNYELPFKVAAAPVVVVAPKSCATPCSGTYSGASSTTITPGYCEGTVAGSSPQTWEGEDCGGFQQSKCGTSWETHGCRWVKSKTVTTAPKTIQCSTLSSKSSCGTQSSCSWDTSCDPITTPSVIVTVNGLENPDPVKSGTIVDVRWRGIDVVSCKEEGGRGGTGIVGYFKAKVLEKTTFTVTCMDESGNPIVNPGGNPTSCLEYYPTCFIADTMVIMADNSQKNIQDVRVGDILKGETTNNTVLGLHRPELNGKLYSFNGGRYFVTEEHPFKTTDGWKSINPKKTAQENIGIEVTPLYVGDTLVTKTGLVKIKTIDSKEGASGTDLFNFLLTGDHTYYADGYLVHNKQMCLLPDNTVFCGKNNFCVLDGEASYTGGDCPMACDPASYRKGSTGCDSGYTSICSGNGAIQCVQNSCSGGGQTGHCQGTVVGSSPQTYEGQSCEPFAQSACGTSWISHGCHWVTGPIQ